MASLYCACSKKTSELRKLTRIVMMIMMSMIVGVKHPFSNFFLAIEDRLAFLCSVNDRFFGHDNDRARPTVDEGEIEPGPPD